MYLMLEPLMSISRMVQGPTLEQLLMARHELIDRFLTELIESGNVTQIIEVAAGLSPRGTAFTKKYRTITYVEADLEDMAAHKRNLLGDTIDPSCHRVVTIDAFKKDGEHSFAAIIKNELSPDKGTAIITEGT